MYKSIKQELDYYAKMRGDTFGILVGKDEYAIKYQNKRMRLEIVESFLEYREPNWYVANYLDRKEIERRNELNKG